MILTGKNSGFDMTFNTDTGIYQLIDEGAVIKESKSLDAIEKFIVSGGEKKEKKKFKRVAILVKEGWGDNSPFIKSEATSIAEPVSFRNKTEFWIVNGEGKREKKSDVLLDVPKNHTILKQIDLKYKAKKTIEDEMDNLRKGLEYLTPEMMTD